MMKALTGAEIVEVWERGGRRNGGGRGLAILAAVYPEAAPDALAGLTVGRRDALLLEARGRTFGPELAAIAACPACGEALEFAVEIASLRPAKSGPDSACNDSESILSGTEPPGILRGTEPPGILSEAQRSRRTGGGVQSKDAPLQHPDAQPVVFQWSRPGCHVAFRLPTAGDLESIGDGSIGDGSIADGAITDGASDAERALLARCVLAAELDGAAVTGGALPEDVAAEVAAAIGAAAAEHDPQAEILLNLACPACGHAWQVPFDIAAFFWAEIAAQAGRLLREVDILARAYGWREADILALTPARRQAYLDMVQG